MSTQQRLAQLRTIPSWSGIRSNRMRTSYKPPGEVALQSDPLFKLLERSQEHFRYHMLEFEKLLLECKLAHVGQVQCQVGSLGMFHLRGASAFHYIAMGRKFVDLGQVL